MPALHQEKPVDRKKQLRDSLAEALAVAEGLQGHCGTIEDLIGLLRLAGKNDAQLSLIAGILIPQED